MTTEGNYTPDDLNRQYASRHSTRTDVYKGLPFANYGYWPQDGMTIDEASAALVDLLADELQLTADDTMLECGCGYGAAAIQLATQTPVAHITGRDVTEVRIATGQELVKKHGHEGRIDLAVGDATKLSFDDAFFSRVLAIECAFHFNTREQFFHEAFRVLKPGGRLVMTDIVIAPHIDVPSQTLEQLRTHMSAKIKMIPDANLYNEVAFREKLSAAGFTDLKLYSISDKNIRQFADAMEKSAETAPPETRAKRIMYANSFREEFLKGADYLVVNARKPA
jgi:cyclopropane fatty-acyl-phospholipid synthase-like methyltransferase